MRASPAGEVGGASARQPPNRGGGVPASAGGHHLPPCRISHWRRLRDREPPGRHHSGDSRRHRASRSFCTDRCRSPPALFGATVAALSRTTGAIRTDRRQRNARRLPNTRAVHIRTTIGPVDNRCFRHRSTPADWFHTEVEQCQNAALLAAQRLSHGPSAVRNPCIEFSPCRVHSHVRPGLVEITPFQTGVIS